MREYDELSFGHIVNLEPYTLHAIRCVAGWMKVKGLPLSHDESA